MAFRLVNKDRLLAPRKCAICTMKPAHRVVDTGYNNINGTRVKDDSRGRKYVCEACGEKIGKAFGMLVQSSVNGLKERIISLENDLEEARLAADLSGQIEAAIALMTKGHDDAAPAEVENDSTD